LASRREQKYFCTVVSEGVEIALKRRSSLSGSNELFVRCNDRDCQYVDLNQSPCPLRLDLFIEEIVRIEKRKRDRKMAL
jgi:hypothetical protein